MLIKRHLIKKTKCISIEQLTNNDTPVYIFNDMKECLNQKNYQEASKLYLLGLSYGFFDTKRVSDKSSYQVVPILAIEALKGQSKEAVKTMINDAKGNIESNTSICKSLSKLGPPTYTPKYMINHGMNAFLGGSSLVKNFDKEAAWKQTLDKYIKCSKKR